MPMKPAREKDVPAAVQPRKNLSVPEWVYDKIRKAAFARKTKMSRLLETFANTL